MYVIHEGAAPHRLDPKMMGEFRKHLILEEKSQATIEKYQRDIGHFFRFCTDGTFGKEDVIQYKQWLMTRYAVRSVTSMLIALNRFLRFIGAEECCVRTPRVQQRIFADEQKTLSREEYHRLLEVARRRGQIRLYLALQTICATGIRVSELQYFTVEAVRTGQIEIRCKGKIRTILIPGKLRKMLLDYAGKNGIRNGSIFVGRDGKPLSRSCIWGRMKRLCGAAGVRACKVFPHNLRKLFARVFYSVEKDIAKLADVLGHSSINTTRIYIMTTGLEHRRQLERLGLVV